MALKNRFEDKKTLETNHMRTLWDVSTLNKESFSGLRRLLRRIAILPLQALGEPVNYWDIIIHLMTTKLDTVTKREWEKTQSVITGDIKLSNFTNFLETQCIYLERMMIEKFLSQPSKS